MLAYGGICWHIVTHMNVDISWRMNMLTPIGISIGVPKLPNAIYVTKFRKLVSSIYYKGTKYCLLL